MTGDEAPLAKYRDSTHRSQNVLTPGYINRVASLVYETGFWLSKIPVVNIRTHSGLSIPDLGA